MHPYTTDMRNASPARGLQPLRAFNRYVELALESGIDLAPIYDGTKVSFMARDADVRNLTKLGFHVTEA